MSDRNGAGRPARTMEGARRGAGGPADHEMTSRRAIDEAKKGSAEVVILAIIEQESHHGYEIAKLIELKTSGSLTFTLASLYATLYRLEDRGWIKGRWVEKAGQRRRCYYRITESGRKVLVRQREDWSRFVAALGQVAGVKFA
jgi:PadR family transcriptional regulator, regulatory protein PadR